MKLHEAAENNGITLDGQFDWSEKSRVPQLIKTVTLQEKQQLGVPENKPAKQMER
jgi:hypothetical protein